MNATIEAKPYPYALGTSAPCLILIDMQRDFIEPGGFGEALGNDVAPLKNIIPATRRLLDVFRRLNLPVIHTREAHRPDLSDCPPSKRRRGQAALRIGDEGPMGRILVDGAAGNAIIDELAPISGEIELVKPGKGAFFGTKLHSILQDMGVTHLIFGGVTTEVCVQTTMREANDRGYECLLAEDATESYFPAFKQATLEMIVAQSGIVGWVSNTASIVASLEQAYAKTE